LKSGKKTNYGVWNAVIRVDMSKFGEAGSAPDRDIRDITIACIGECNEKFTGPRDGKTLHKFLTKGLLLRAGVTSPNGYFGRYESYIKRVTPKDMMDCGSGTVSGGPAKSGNPFQQFLSIFKKKPDTIVVAPPAQGTGDVSKNQD
jgi:hypothetical protein